MNLSLILWTNIRQVKLYICFANVSSTKICPLLSYPSLHESKIILVTLNNNPLPLPKRRLCQFFQKLIQAGRHGRGIIDDAVLH